MKKKIGDLAQSCFFCGAFLGVLAMVITNGAALGFNYFLIVCMLLASGFGAFFVNKSLKLWDALCEEVKGQNDGD